MRAAEAVSVLQGDGTTVKLVVLIISTVRLWYVQCEIQIFVVVRGDCDAPMPALWRSRHLTSVRDDRATVSTKSEGNKCSVWLELGNEQYRTVIHKGKRRCRPCEWARSNRGVCPQADRHIAGDDLFAAKTGRPSVSALETFVNRLTNTYHTSLHWIYGFEGRVRPRRWVVASREGSSAHFAA